MQDCLRSTTWSADATVCLHNQRIYAEAVRNHFRDAHVSGWSKMILQVRTPDAKVLGWLTKPVGCSAKLLEMMLEMAMVVKLTLYSWATAQVGSPAVSMPMANSLETWNMWHRKSFRPSISTLKNWRKYKSVAVLFLFRLYYLQF